MGLTFGGMEIITTFALANGKTDGFLIAVNRQPPIKVR